MRMRLLLLSLVALSACDVPTAPRAQWELPEAVAIDPPAIYRVWWTDLETCSGLTGDFDRVQFYVAPVLVYDGKEILGLWILRGNKIIVAAAWQDVQTVVAHEMMHALRRASGHPAAYFNGTCGNLLA